MSNRKIAQRKLLKEFKILKSQEPKNFIAVPSQENILTWFFVIFGMDDPYEGGVFMGKILFPSDYPFKPPDIIFITPNGRFATNKKICLSFTSYHPETWGSWSIEGMMIGLISYFVTDNQTTGSLRTPSYIRRQIALESFFVNLKNETFKKYFKEYYGILKVTADEYTVREDRLKELKDKQFQLYKKYTLYSLSFFIIVYIIIKMFNQYQQGD